MLSDEEGDFLVKLARKSIETYLKEKRILEVPEDTPKTLKEDMGAFVTLNRNGQLRGCIGYPEPIKPLVNAVIEVAISSALQDPRFPPVTSSELENLHLEVSVLTKPEIIMVDKPNDYPEKIIVGEDGLIVESGYSRGLLLPQVAVEWQWDAEDFLSNTCMKAGLNADCWLDPQVKIYKFQGQIFQE
ncbi:MAG: TIGR00296 family protein [Methanobacterium sp.]|nr:TIGR00296 family protein [Methanobacterium sp.]